MSVSSQQWRMLHWYIALHAATSLKYWERQKLNAMRPQGPPCRGRCSRVEMETKMGELQTEACQWAGRAASLAKEKPAREERSQ